MKASPLSINMAKLFRTISHGVYVIGVSDGKTDNAFTAAWVMQASFQPLMLALSINPAHSSYTLLKAGGVFSVNVLSEDQSKLAEHFAASASSRKLAVTDWQRYTTIAPVIDEAMAFFECELAGEIHCGDHCIVTGSVVNGGLRSNEKKALGYLQTADMDQSAQLYPESFPPGLSP